MKTCYNGAHRFYCGAVHERARRFRKTRPQLVIYRCYDCQRLYNLYSGTLFEGKHLRQGVLLLRGFCQGTPSARLARELGLGRTAVLDLRRKLQAGA